MWEALLSLLFPPRCPGCREYTENKGDWCQKCLGATLKVRSLPLSKQLRSTVVAVYALGEYHGVLRELIKKLKYHGQRNRLPYLASFLQQAAPQIPWPPEKLLAVPIPLSRKREKSRGFNQAELIFADWLKSLGVPLAKILERTLDTAPMYNLSPKERQANLQNAFALAPQASVSGQNILLLDDIFTTGATIFACGQVLRRAGANKIYGLVLASDRGKMTVKGDEP
ncbi:MAG: ComF family protein [Selenomonadaceae bacterium]|nr:ComF family protein [Selenomonadaceae bacterium]